MLDGKNKLYITALIVVIILIGVSLIFNIGNIRNFLTSAWAPPSDLFPAVKTSEPTLLPDN